MGRTIQHAALMGCSATYNLRLLVTLPASLRRQLSGTEREKLAKVSARRTPSRQFYLEGR